MRALPEFAWHEYDVLELVLHGLEPERALREPGCVPGSAWAGPEAQDAVVELRAALRELADPIIALDDGLSPASPDIEGPGPGVLGDADAAVTDAVIELGLARIGRQAADVRGPTMREALLEFLS